METVTLKAIEKETLKGAANLRDVYAYCYLVGGKTTANPKECEVWLNDGHACHAQVGIYRSNSFGLHDVLGNLFEWCQDTHHKNYEGAPNDGAAWVEDKSTKWIYRGGSYNHMASHCRSTIRGHFVQGHELDILGIRPAASLRGR